MRTVGIRQLRDNLSRYLNEVRKGQVIYITDHNIPVAQITPLKAETEPAIAEMQARREVFWNGKKPKGNPFPARLKDNHTVADAVIEDRR